MSNRLTDPMRLGVAKLVTSLNGSSLGMLAGDKLPQGSLSGTRVVHVEKGSSLHMPVMSSTNGQVDGSSGDKKMIAVEQKIPQEIQNQQQLAEELKKGLSALTKKEEIKKAKPTDVLGDEEVWQLVSKETKEIEGSSLQEYRDLMKKSYELMSKAWKLVDKTKEQDKAHNVNIHKIRSLFKAIVDDAIDRDIEYGGLEVILKKSKKELDKIQQQHQELFDGNQNEPLSDDLSADAIEKRAALEMERTHEENQFLDDGDTDSISLDEFKDAVDFPADDISHEAGSSLSSSRDSMESHF